MPRRCPSRDAALRRPLPWAAARSLFGLRQSAPIPEHEITLDTTDIPPFDILLIGYATIQSPGACQGLCGEPAAQLLKWLLKGRGFLASLRSVSVTRRRAAVRRLWLNCVALPPQQTVDARVETSHPEIIALGGNGTCLPVEGPHCHPPAGRRTRYVGGCERLAGLAKSSLTRTE